MVYTSPSKLETGVKILLIEDNDISRQLMSDFLINCGYDVYSLGEAKDFDSVMEFFKPNLILLDIKLPGIDGYTVLQQIQQRVDWKKIPVVVVSAFAFNADQQRALALGARRYLVKPIRLAELTEVIDQETACLFI